MLYISSSWIKNINFYEGIKTLSGITKNIELSGGARYREDLFNKIKELKESMELNLLIHGYFPPSEESEFLLNLSDSGSGTRKFISESMKYVYEFDIPYYSLHSGFKRLYSVKNSNLVNSSISFRFEDVLDNINWFTDTYSDKKLAIENLYPIKGDVDCAFCMRPTEIVKLMELSKSSYLLLDLGHLKVSAKYLGFDFVKSAEMLIQKYQDRILEVHLSENNGMDDDHLPIDRHSEHHGIISRNMELIKKYNINLVIESRNASCEEIKDSFLIFSDLF